MNRALDLLWAFIKRLGLFFWSIAIATWKILLLVYKSTLKFTVSYVDLVLEQQFVTWGPARIIMQGFLLLFVPIIAFIVPVGFFAMILAVVVIIDQVTWPTWRVDSRFVTIAEEVNGVKPELKDIGATLFTSTYWQMENELRSAVIGWTPNDWYLPRFWFFDNKMNRQLGVLHASRELLEAMSLAISKLGSTDEEDFRLVAARQQGFAFEPTSWMFPNSEDRYWDAIRLIKEYQAELRAGHTDKATVNLTNTDIESILLAITDRVLEVPHGRLNARTFDVAWNELDDRVYFAQGAAIVARDALVALRYAFEAKITEAGAIANLDQAIASLEGAVEFHPWWVMAGDDDSMFADHRSKMSRYYTDARNRIKDVANAINR